MTSPPAPPDASARQRPASRPLLLMPLVAFNVVFDAPMRGDGGSTGVQLGTCTPPGNLCLDVVCPQLN